MRSASRSTYVVAVGMLVAIVPWFPVPGRTVADTKLDLVVDPWFFLGRASSAWDSHAFFGQLQNQSYGYLFPMGPFFGVTRGLGMPEWACQRLWWSVVLVVGFAGFYVLVRRWEIAGQRAAVVAAVAYAMSPHALTVLGPISIEQWPSAMAPWLLLAAHRLMLAQGSVERRRAVALVGLSFAVVGGVNATATLAAAILPAVYLLAAGRAGIKVAGWWVIGILAGALWWAVPLVVLGAYAFPFLDFIELSRVTTAVTSVPNMLRGASHWVAFIGDGSGRGEWPAGSALATRTLPVIATAVVAVTGVMGLLINRPWIGRDRVRLFAILSVLIGTTAMGIGFGAGLDLPFTSPFSSGARTLLDGPLAAFRNVHKLDPLVRLPVCLGLAALIRTVHEMRLPARFVASGLPGRTIEMTTLGVVCAALLVATSPAVGGALTPPGSFSAIPSRWYEAARTVDQLAAKQGGTTLLAPSSRFAEFTWGDTRDNPLESLTRSGIVARDAIPLGSPGAIRVMDALDGQLRRGAEQPGLLDLLARMGIGRVVVPHDSVQNGSDAGAFPDSGASTTERTLRASGLRLVRVWGSDGTRLTVWSTDRPVSRTQVFDEKAAVEVTGGPESIVSLAAQGLLGADSPAYLVRGQAAPTASRQIQTDTLRKRALDVSSTVPNQYSATLQPDQGAGRRDFPPATSEPATTRAFAGLRSVTSTSSSADPTEPGFTSPASALAAAFDADFDTAWLSAADDERPAVSLTLPRRTRAGVLRLSLASGAEVGDVQRVVVDVDGVRIQRRVDEDDVEVAIPLDRAVRSVRVRLVPSFAQPRFPVGIANIGIEGVDIAAVLRLPAGDDDTSETARGGVVMSRDTAARDSAVGRIDDGRVLSREFATAQPQPVTSVLLRARATPEVERLIDGWAVSGPRSSDDPRARPGAALDGDPSTRWTVGYLAGNPTMRLTLDGTRTITGITGSLRGRTKVSSVRSVTVRDVDSGEERSWTPTSRTFEPLRAHRVALTFGLSSRADHPFAMPDLTLVGAGTPPARQPASVVEVPCSMGAVVDVGGTPSTYAAAMTRDQLLDGAAVTGRPCGPNRSRSSAGVHQLRATSSEVVDVESVALGTAAPVPGTAAAPRADVVSWDDRHRVASVEADASPRVIAWHEGFNPGWRAELGGRALKAVEVDGWRQAFVIPAGSSGVIKASFAPDRPYRYGLAGGGVALVVLVLLAGWRGPRRSRRVASVALRPAHLWGWVPRGLAILVPALLGGVGGLVLGLVAAAMPRRWRPVGAVAAAGLLALTMGGSPLLVPGSALTTIPQACGIFLLGLLAASCQPAMDTLEHGALQEAPREIGDQH